MKKDVPKFIHFPNFVNGREVVIHTQCPRFIAEVQKDENGNVGFIFSKMEFFDPPQADAIGLSKLMSRLGDWYHFTVIEKKS